MSSAASSSDGSWTRVIPTELPSRAGLTISRGSAAAGGERVELGADARPGRVAQRAALTSRQSTTGRPMPRHIRLKSVLSIPIAEAATPDPV